MSLIPPAQWRPLFDAVYEMNTATDHADFLSAVVKGMSRLIRQIFVWFMCSTGRRKRS